MPEILERLGPERLSSEHQQTVRSWVKRLHDLTGAAYSTIYSDLGMAFHVARYSDMTEAEWQNVAAWFKQRIETSGKAH